MLRVSGPRARDAAAAIAGRLPPPRQAALRTLRDPADRRILDRALVLLFPAPRSATGEDIVEFHVHGGRAVVAAVERAVVAQPGCRAAEAGEFTRRAFANGRIDLIEAEGLADLLAAETEDQRRRAIEATEGHVSRRVEEWGDRILALSARAEALLDFDDEDDVAVDEHAIGSEALAIAKEMAIVLAQPPVEKLYDGPLVALAGPPNAGKSTLLNALARRDAAIVSPIAGTTRDRIEIAVVRAGLVYRLVDTAGLRDAGSDVIEAEGIDRARRALKSADLILWLGDDAPPPGPAVTLWLNPRADQPGRAVAPSDRLTLSAATGSGMDDLWRRIESICASLIPAQDVLAINVRQRNCLMEAHGALVATNGHDILLAAEHLRIARRAVDHLLGRAGVEDMLDALFGRFCIGK